MRIAVLLAQELNTFPPTLGLVSALCDLKQNVTLISYGASDINGYENLKGKVGIVDMGRRKQNTVGKVEQSLTFRKQLRRFLAESVGQFDVIWVMTVNTAREAGEILRKYHYVIFISELQEEVPSMANGILRGNKPAVLKDKHVKQLARDANLVIVPEYNRAHMQKVLWDLPKLPAVLPNKQTPPSCYPEKDEYKKIHDRLESETRKILLYQGVFNTDRNLTPFVDALDYLNGEYSLYLFGKITNEKKDVIERLSNGRDDVHYCGFIPSPNHLQFTKHAFIGLLPYSPTKNNICSPFNALYCAPNKIWEYAFFGIPMLGSDVPGLTLPFDKWNIGLTTSTDDPEQIACCIRDIEKSHTDMSRNAAVFFESFDYTAEVERLLIDASS